MASQTDMVILFETQQGLFGNLHVDTIPDDFGWRGALRRSGWFLSILC